MAIAWIAAWARLCASGKSCPGSGRPYGGYAKGLFHDDEILVRYHPGLSVAVRDVKNRHQTIMVRQRQELVEIAGTRAAGKPLHRQRSTQRKLDDQDAPVRHRPGLPAGVHC